MSEKDEYLKFLVKEKEIADKIIDHSRSMISIINRNYIYEKVNSTFCNAHKVTGSIVGKTLGEVWGQETFQKVIKSNIDLCFTGKTIRYEAIFNTPNSGKRFFEVTFHPIVAENGEITHLMADTFDIHDLKLSEQAAFEKEEDFRNLETNLPIGFLRCDMEGKIIHANKAFLNIMELPAEDRAADLNLKNFYPDAGFFDMQFSNLLECHSKSFGRILLNNGNGKEIFCRINGFLAVDEKDIPTFIDFIVEDSTREIMLESRLIQAQKLETIGALAGGIAHDFNNILATISGYSEMLQDDLPRSSASSEKVRKIQSAVVKAQSLINQILTFSRQVEQEKIPVDVSEVLKETIGFMRSALTPKINIRSRIQKRKVNIFADPTQLFRVFLNLMTNAVQAIEDEGGTISVRLDVVDAKRVQHELHKDIVADEYVLLTFEDSGKGMDASLMGRIFEPFFTTREVGKGTGLGLSVVHGIITEMDGEIFVSSRKEKGSVFYVYLPVSKEYADFEASIDGRKKILFIKGNKHESRIFSLALENSGHELIYVSDQKNLEMVMSDIAERPDLIIYMDESKQIRPENLIGLFRKFEINTPCIFITDPDQEKFEEKILNSGIIKQQLFKPVSLKEISNAIQISLK